MRINDNNFKRGDVPTIITDLNGTIVHLNNRAITDLYPIKVGDSVSKFVELDHIKKLSVFSGKIDVVVPKTSKYEKLIIKSVGTGATRTIELYFVHSEKDDINEIERDKRFFSTYREVSSIEMNQSVKLNDFTRQIVDNLHADLRFAYRKFNIVKTEENENMYANYARLSAIVVGFIVALNEIEYRNPIELSIERVMNEYSLNISVATNTFKNAEGLHDIAELYPRIAMRLLYIASLCDDDGIRYKFRVKPNSVSGNFIISEAVNKTGKFSCASGFSQSAFISYILDIFSKASSNDTSKEELE